MTRSEIEQIFGLDEKYVKVMEEELIGVYGEDYESITMDKFFSHIPLEKIQLKFLRNLTNIQSYYYQDCDTFIYMVMGLCNAKEVRLDDSVSAFYDKVTDKDDKNKWNKELINYFLHDGCAIGIGNYTKDWCLEFKKLFLCKENYEIFDVDKINKGKKKTDITRYGAFKSKCLLDDLKETKIENRILFDFQLGISLTNCIYEQIGWVNQLKILEKVERIIKLIASLPCSYIRNEIALEVFGEISRYGFKDEVIKKLEEELRTILPIIENYFWFMVKVTWINIIKNGESIEELLNEEREKQCEWMDAYEYIKISDEMILAGKGKVAINEALLKDEPERVNKGNIFERMGRSVTGESKDLKKIKLIQELNNAKYPLFEEYSLENVESMDKLLESIINQNKNFLNVKDEIKKPQRELSHKNIYAVIHRKVMEEILHNIFV